MPIVKLLRGGQLTLPADVRKQAQLSEGDLIEVSLSNGTITLKPVIALSPDEARARIEKLLTKAQKAASSSGKSEEDIAKLIDEEIASVRKKQRAKSTHR